MEEITYVNTANPLPTPRPSPKQSFTLFKKHCAAIPTTSKNVVNVFLTKYGCNFVNFQFA